MQARELLTKDQLKELNKVGTFERYVEEGKINSKIIPEVYLYPVKVKDKTISNVEWQGFNAEGSSFENVIFENGLMEKGWLKNSIFKSVVFRNMKISEYQFEDSVFEDIVFDNCQIIDANMIALTDVTNIKIINCDFNDVYLSTFSEDSNITVVDSKLSESSFRVTGNIIINETISSKTKIKSDHNIIISGGEVGISCSSATKGVKTKKIQVSNVTAGDLSLGESIEFILKDSKLDYLSLNKIEKVSIKDTTIKLHRYGRKSLPLVDMHNVKCAKSSLLKSEIANLNLNYVELGQVECIESNIGSINFKHGNADSLEIMSSRIISLENDGVKLKSKNISKIGNSTVAKAVKHTTKKSFFTRKETPKLLKYENIHDAEILDLFD